MKLLLALMIATGFACAEDAPKQGSQDLPTCTVSDCPSVTKPDAAKDATIQRQQQLIQALQAKIAALLAYMSADENIRALQAPAKEQGK